MSNTKIFVLALLTITLVAGVFYFSSVLSLFAVSALIAFILNPIAKTIQKRFRLKKIISILIVFAILCILITVAIVSLLPELINQSKSFVSNMETYEKVLVDIVNLVLNYAREHGVSQVVTDYIYTFISGIDAYITSIILSVASSVLSFSARILDVVIVIIITVYFMLDTRFMLEKISRLFSEKYSQKFLKIVNDGNDAIWKYLKVKTIISACMGIAVFIIFKFFGIEYALLLAIFCFIMDYIPYFGSIFAGVVAFIVILVTNSFTEAVVVIILVTLVQQIEGNVIVPKVQGNELGLHPIIVIFSVLACNVLWGPLGMFIAIPIAAILKLILLEVYEYLVS